MSYALYSLLFSSPLDDDIGIAAEEFLYILKDGFRFNWRHAIDDSGRTPSSVDIRGVARSL
jgi:hypothetical protein